jgi:catechol 2,3-dioxygenase-like lactoylglutathione lyase family enzyme
MRVYRISAVTLKIKDMVKSCEFYSNLPGFKLVYGGPSDPFSTFEVGEGSMTHLNLELVSGSAKVKREDFGRIIFYTEDVDKLYHFMKSDKTVSNTITFENEPADAPWGERFFHVREPDGYQLSFARPLAKQ